MSKALDLGVSAEVLLLASDTTDQLAVQLL